MHAEYTRRIVVIHKKSLQKVFATDEYLPLVRLHVLTLLVHHAIK
jgi:hypothetical protein